MFCFCGRYTQFLGRATNIIHVHSRRIPTQFNSEMEREIKRRKIKLKIQKRQQHNTKSYRTVWFFSVLFLSLSSLFFFSRHDRFSQEISQEQEKWIFFFLQRHYRKSFLNVFVILSFASYVCVWVLLYQAKVKDDRLRFCICVCNCDNTVCLRCMWLCVRSIRKENRKCSFWT